LPLSASTWRVVQWRMIPSTRSGRLLILALVLLGMLLRMSHGLHSLSLHMHRLRSGYKGSRVRACVVRHEVRVVGQLPPVHHACTLQHGHHQADAESNVVQLADVVFSTAHVLNVFLLAVVIAADVVVLAALLVAVALQSRQRHAKQHNGTDDEKNHTCQVCANSSGVCKAAQRGKCSTYYRPKTTLQRRAGKGDKRRSSSQRCSVLT